MAPKVGWYTFWENRHSCTVDRTIIVAATYKAIWQHLTLKWPNNATSGNVSHRYILVLVEIG